MNKCEHCDGVGYFVTGQRTLQQCPAPNTSTEDIKENCKACNGPGKVLHTSRMDGVRKCPFCNACTDDDDFDWHGTSCIEKEIIVQV